MAEEPTVESLQAQLTTTQAQLDLAKRDGADLAKVRADHERATAALTEAEEQIKKTKEEAEGKITEISRTKGEKLINAELKAAAVGAGARSFQDVLALVDRTALKLDANGELENGDELIAALKASKPYLFAGAASTHTEVRTARQPAAGTGQKNAKEMTKEEYAAAKAALTKR